jgi:hypothetical protein
VNAPAVLFPTFKPNPKQPAANRLLTGGPDNVLLRGGSRSGKTFIIVRRIVIRCLRAPGSRHVHFRQFYNHAKASVGLDTFPKVLKLCFPHLYGRVEFNHEGIATFPNGAEFWLAGLDDKERVEKILGLEFATIYYGEISTMSYHAREVAQSRLAQKVQMALDSNFEPYPEGVPLPLLPLKSFYDMNPGGKRHWSFQLFVRKLVPGTNEPVPNPEDYAHFLMNPDDNRENLPPGYIEKTLAGMSKAKRRRFLEGEWANDVEGALWNDTMLDQARIASVPRYANRAEFERIVEPLVRVVIGVDPSGSGGESVSARKKAEVKTSNDIGIVAAGLGKSGKGYVLEDATLNASPGVWGAKVVETFDRWGADKVIAEPNFGGAMVEFVLQTARSTLPVKLVTSSKGKSLRAEPIAALYEDNQLKIKHAGAFPDLEDQMAAMMPQPVGYTGDGSPDRLDAAVFALTELMLGSAYNLENL